MADPELAPLSETLPGNRHETRGLAQVRAAGGDRDAAGRTGFRPQSTQLSA